MTPPHYKETKAMLMRYRAVLLNLEINGNTFNEEKIKSLHLDVEKMRETYNRSLEIKNTIDTAVLNLQATHIYGYKLYKVLYLRFLSPRHDINSTDDVLQALRYEGISMSEAQYFKLLSAGISTLSHFIFGDEYEFKTICSPLDDEDDD